MLKNLNITPEDPEELRAVNRLLADEVKSQALHIEKLKHQLAGQNRHRFGLRSESLDQLNLTFEEDEKIAEAASFERRLAKFLSALHRKRLGTAQASIASRCSIFQDHEHVEL